jgi:hypothetical protein
MVDKPTDIDNKYLMSIFRQYLLSHHRLFIAFMTSAFILFVVSPSHSQVTRMLFREDFNDLGNWSPVYFPKITSHTLYSIEKNGGEAFLKAVSNASASALMYKREYNVYDYPGVRWRWKVNNVYSNVNPEKKSGDDYPIRVYIIFKYDSESANAIDTVKYGIAKRLYGEYPPHSTLNYVWANNVEQKAIIISPYTDKAKLITLEKGNGKVETWQNEEVNILQDYRRAFGVDPPAIASVAIMNDSDNTGQKSVSYINFIEVFEIGK